MKEMVREAMDRLDKAYPCKELLNRKEAANFLGASPDTVSRYIQHQDGGMYSKLKIAHYLVD